MLQTLRHTNRQVSRKAFRRALAAIGSVTLVVLPVVAAQAPASAASGGVTVTNYTHPTIRFPVGIAAGPDGALWFTNDGGPSIGRIATDGTVTNYTGLLANSSPGSITAGPDGALWFTNWNGLVGNQSIGRVTTGGTVTNYTDATISNPEEITSGPDGALWFTKLNNPSIGRITTDGTVTSYAVGPAGAITAGPDGALWFATNNSIQRMTTDGVVTNIYTDPTISSPTGITAGPDGALWFINGGSSIGRITTTGSITNYTDPAINASGDIAAGPDGALWFTNGGLGGTSIGRITTTGSVSTYTDTTINTPSGITAGPDGALWFTNLSGNSIGRITTPPPAVVPFGGVVTEAASGTSQLDITVTLSHPSPQTVTVQWNTVFINGASNVQAIPGTDYIAASGTVSFPPGATTETVPITVVNHDLGMPYKLLVVSFHNPTNAGIGGYWGLGFGFLVNNTS